MTEGAIPALALFAAYQFAGILAVILANGVRGRPLVKSLAHSWYSRWYLHIAAHGYGDMIWISPQRPLPTDWAFFPQYPGLIRALSTILPFTPGQAALLIS